MRTQENRATKLTAGRLSAALDARFGFVRDAAGSVTGLIFHSLGGQNITVNRSK